MALSVTDFRSSAARLGQDDAIKLKADGGGLATTGWQRFKLAVSELFTGRATLEARQEQAIVQFKDALKREYGPKLAEVASDHLWDTLNGGPLTRQIVELTIGMLEARGGQFHVRNEILVREFASTVYPPREKTAPSLSSVVNPILDRVLDAAQDAGLSRESVEEFRRSFTPGIPGLGHEMPDISVAIRNALRQAATVDTPAGKGFRLLDRDEARQIASEAAEKAMLSRINQRHYTEYSRAHPFAEDFTRKAAEQGLSEHIPLMNQHQINELVLFALQNADHVLSRDEVAAEREKVLDRVFARQTEKLEQIATLDLPDGPEKDEIVATALGTRSAMGREFFGRVDRTAMLVTDALGAMARTENPADRERMAMDLARAIREEMRGAKIDSADDNRNFLSMATEVVSARVGDGLGALAGGDGRPVLEMMKDLSVRLQMSDAEEPDQIEFGLMIGRIAEGLERRLPDGAPV